MDCITLAVCNIDGRCMNEFQVARIVKKVNSQEDMIKAVKQRFSLNESEMALLLSKNEGAIRDDSDEKNGRNAGVGDLISYLYVLSS